MENFQLYNYHIYKEYMVCVSQLFDILIIL